MCFITKKKKRSIATEDIHVWKLLCINNYAQFKRFKYEEGVTYKTRMLNIPKNATILGYDTVVCDFLNKNYPNWTNKIPELIYIGQGFHSIKSLRRVSKLRRYKRVEFIIPKGAKYYEDENELMVSNQIRMK